MSTRETTEEMAGMMSDRNDVTQEGCDDDFYNCYENASLKSYLTYWIPLYSKVITNCQKTYSVYFILYKLISFNLVYKV